jgi:lysozyme family protein
MIMTKTRFERCIPIVLKHEGGYVNHPNDPGGETNYGISKRSFPNEDIKNLTVNRAKEIYKEYYWDKMGVEGLEDLELCLHVFDHGINAGPKISIKMLQQLAGVNDDGVIGPITLEAVNSKDLLDSFAKARVKFYIRLATKRAKLKVFLQGWLNRVTTTRI